MPATERVFQTVSSHFLDSTGWDRKEKDFLSTLCFYLGIKIANRDDFDSMKHAINNYILDQVDDWMKEKDPAIIDGILDGNLKRLREAQAFLRDREGTPQIHWKQVLENHVKLIAAYSHILAITLPTF